MNSLVTPLQFKCFPKETTSKQFFQSNLYDSGGYVVMNSLLEDNNSGKEIATYQTAQKNFNQKEEEHTKTVYLKPFN